MTKRLRDFPPFYTLQLNIETRTKQLLAWSHIIRDEYPMFIVDLSGHLHEVFTNSKLKRGLSPEFLESLCEFLVEQDLGEWIVKRSQFLTFKRSIGDWAALVHSWATKTGKINSIESVFGVFHGDDSRGELFHEIPNRVALRSLIALENLGKCELTFRTPDDFMTYGVKFFA
jgi:ESCRT-II complex subunit VPS25